MPFDSQIFPVTRLRRLRYNPSVRNMIRATHLSVSDLVFPLFIKEGLDQPVPVKSMPGQFQLGVQHLAEEIKEIKALGIPAVLLFGVPTIKDGHGSAAFHDDGIVQSAIKEIKSIAPDLCVIADVCCCEYTDHGHCGIIPEGDQLGVVDNDVTLGLYVRQAISFVKAGADIIAPSGMMDGMVTAIRHGLDGAGYNTIPIMSYSVKFNSGLYGPFRDGTEGAPQFGDRQTYQMDMANADEALREAQQDVNEGADMIMVKPAGAYLDIIYRVKQSFPGVPLVAYQVSGEYAMIKAAVENGWLDGEKIMMESLLAIKRAGADIIINYFAKDVAKVLQK